MSRPAQLLYESGPRIQPRVARGRFARLRLATIFVLLGFFYGAPWIQIKGMPMIWFDLPHRHFHILGQLFAPQDLILLSALLILSAMSLFLFTTIAGRVWCGYACPQTVWTELFLWIEHAIEGDRHERLRLDKSPWNARKILRRGAKHAAWIAAGVFTGLSFVAYFIPARTLFPEALHLQLAGWPLFWSLFYGFATWGNAGFMREQVCKYMCPYARFQSAMFDRDTLIISYDEKRGEPRKGPAAKQAGKTGDCVNCTLCVQVCPAGIDIRKGLQYECIACAACVDVCDDVMETVGRPKGLIRYTSANQLDGGSTRLLRPRAIGYGVIWASLAVALCVLLWIRSPLQLDILRDRHSLYRETAEGRVENIYSIKLENRDASAHEILLTASIPGHADVRVIPDRIALQAGEKTAVTTTVSILPGPEAGAAESLKILFSAVASDSPKVTARRKAAFINGASP